MANVRLPSSWRSSLLSNSPCQGMWAEWHFQPTLSQSGQQDYPPAQDPEARDTSPDFKGTFHCPWCFWRLTVTDQGAHCFWKYFNSSKQKTEALSPKEAKIKKCPHQDSSPQSSETPGLISASSQTVWKRASSFNRQHGTHRGTTTDETIRHVAGHSTGPSIQARHLGTHIDESFTVTTSE